MDSIKLRAYAKLNLDLLIIRKMEDDYHEIISTFQAINLYDDLEIKQLTSGYELTGSILCSSEVNIVSKAKKTLEYFIDKELPCAINLIKGIPVGAGLGGGSSDAAAVLVGLRNLYDLEISQEELVRMGKNVGADVPFFVKNIPTAKVQGIGEFITKSRVSPSNYYVLARPNFVKSTSELYKLHDETGKDFLTLTREICPQSDLIYSYLSKLSKSCGVSGSGPTIFAGFESYLDAKKAIDDYGLAKFDGDLFIIKPAQKTFEILFN